MQKSCHHRRRGRSAAVSADLVRAAASSDIQTGNSRPGCARLILFDNLPDAVLSENVKAQPKLKLRRALLSRRTTPTTTEYQPTVEVE